MKHQGAKIGNKRLSVKKDGCIVIIQLNSLLKSELLNPV